MCKNSYNLEHYSLELNFSQNFLKISMQVKSAYANTKSLPSTYSFLEKNFPGVLFTECFNAQNLPFHHEVKETEFGHLFEHIFIEQLKNIKVKNGHEKVVINGRTDWDWNINPHGLFEIFIDAGTYEDQHIEEALMETNNLVALLISSHNNTKSREQLN